jgi:hypothetical protein
MTAEHVDIVTPAHRSRMFGTPVLLVGELRELIGGMDDDTHVVVAGPATTGLYVQDGTGSEWMNVDSVGIPDGVEGGNGFICLTLFPADTFDTRQF